MIEEKKAKITDTILLRTLTEKSRLGFGEYARLTVDEFLNVFNGDAKRELCWAYYNLSKINFNDAVLHRIGIPKHKWILKPGVQPELYDVVIELLPKSADEKVIHDKNKLKLKFNKEI